MISNAQVKELIDDLFEEEALVIGGLAAVHKMDDDLVWRLVKNLDVIRRKVLRRIDDKTPDNGGLSPKQSNITPHPAIEEFLRTLGRG